MLLLVLFIYFQRVKKELEMTPKMILENLVQL